MKISNVTLKKVTVGTAALGLLALVGFIPLTYYRHIQHERGQNVTMNRIAKAVANAFVENGKATTLHAELPGFNGSKSEFFKATAEHNVVTLGDTPIVFVKMLKSDTAEDLNNGKGTSAVRFIPTPAP